MGTVVSLTEAKILELLSNLDGIGLSQDQINALIAQLWIDQEELNAAMEQLQNVTMPQLQEDLAAGSIQVSHLNDEVLPTLEATLSENGLAIQNLNEVTLPGLILDLQNEIDTNAVRPKTYVQADAPADPDENDRNLLIGDRWIDSDDLVERMWNGTEWADVAFDVSLLSDMIEAFISPAHAIFEAPMPDPVPVTNGANIDVI